MAGKNSKAANGYNGLLSLENFKKIYSGLELSDDGYQWLYEHLSDKEVQAAAKGDSTLFSSWENPLARGAGTKLSPGARVSGNAEELKKYLEANAGTLSAADIAYVLKHIEITQKEERLKREADEKLLRGEKRPAKPLVYTDEKGYERLRISQRDPQETSQGCWSVAMQLVTESRGIKDVTQKDIRGHRPQQHKIGEVDVSYGKKGREELTQADEAYNKDTGAVVANMLDAVLDLTPNTMLHVTEIGAFNPYEKALSEAGMTKEKYHSEAKELIRQTVEKAIYIDHSPLVVKEPGHFLSIIGIKGDTLLIQDPRATLKGERLREIPIDEFITKMMEERFEGIQLIWGSDIQLDKDGKTIFGVMEGQASMDKDGNVLLNKQQESENDKNGKEETVKDGLWVNRYGSSDKIPAGDKQPLTKEGLIRTERVYLPQKLNAEALMEEAKARTPEEDRRLADNSRIYYSDVEVLRGLKVKTVVEQGLVAARKEAEQEKLHREEAAKEERLSQVGRRTVRSESEKENGGSQDIPEEEEQLNIDEEYEQPLPDTSLLQDIENTEDMEEDGPVVMDSDVYETREKERRMREQVERVDVVDAREEREKELAAEKERREKEALLKQEEQQRIAEEEKRLADEAAYEEERERKMLRDRADSDDYAVRNDLELLQGFKAIVREQLGEMDRVHTEEEEPDSYATLQEWMQQILHMGVSSTPDMIEATLTDLVRAAERYIPDCEDATRREAVRTVINKGMSTWQKLINNHHEMQNEIKDISIEVTMGKKEQTIRLFRQEDEAMKISVAANEYAKRVEQFVSEAKNFRETFRGLKKFLRSDSTQYSNMITALDKVCGLTRGNSTVEIFEALCDLTGYAKVYKNKIDEKGGESKNGERRYEAVQRLLDALDNSELMEKLPREFDLVKPLNRAAELAVRAEMDFTEVGEDDIYLTDRMTKTEFIEKAQDLGWVNVLSGQNDDVWLGMVYDEAVKTRNPKIGELMGRILTENVWDLGDRAAEANYLSRRILELEKDGLLKKVDRKIAPFMDEDELQSCIENMQNRRKIQGRIDGSPAPYPREDELPEEKVSPYYRQIVGKDGKKAGYSFEEYGLFAHWNDIKTSAGDLDKQGYITEEIRRYNDKAYALRVQPGVEWNASQISEWVVKHIFPDAKLVANAKKAMRLTKEAWLKAKEDAKDQPEAEVIGAFLEDMAFLADPDAGNYAEAIGRNPYLIRLVGAYSGMPLLISNDKNMTKEQVIEALKGEGPAMESLPMHLRQDVWKDCMDLMHFSIDEVRTEYHRQQMALDGWNDEKEAAYVAELTASHEKLITAFHKMLAVKDVGQYDHFMNNAFDHILGKTPNQRRDMFTNIGMLEGELQALKHGWKSDELIVMSSIGGIAAAIEKRKSELKYDTSASAAEHSFLLAMEESFRKLKESVWDKDMTSPQEKRDAAERLMMFAENWKDFANNSLFYYYNNSLSLLKEKVEEYQTVTGPLVPEVRNAWEQELAAQKERCESVYAEKKKKEQQEKAAVQQEADAAVQRARDHGWTSDYAEYITSLVTVKNALDRQGVFERERAERLGQPEDAVKKKEREEAREIVAQVLTEITEKKVRTNSDMRRALGLAEEKLDPFYGNVEALRGHFATAGEAKSLMPGKLGKAQIEDNLKDLAVLTLDSLQGLQTNFQMLYQMLPSDDVHAESVRKIAEQLREQINDIADNMRMEPDGRLHKSCYEQLLAIKDDMYTVIQESMEHVDPNTQPFRYAISDEILLQTRFLGGHRDYETLGKTIAPVGYFARRPIMDLKAFSRKDILGLPVEEQKKAIAEFEKAAAADKEIFDLMKAGREQLRTAYEYSEAQYAAEKEGRAFDEEPYRQKMAEQNLVMRDQAYLLMELIQGSDYRDRKHPEFIDSYAYNMTRLGSISSVSKAADLQNTMFRMKKMMDKPKILESGRIWRQIIRAEILSSDLQKMEREMHTEARKKEDEELAKHSPAMQELREAMGELKSFGDPKKLAVKGGTDLQEEIFSSFRKVQQCAQNVMANEGETDRARKLAENAIEVCTKVLKEREQTVYERLKSVGYEPEKVVDALHRFTAGKHSESARKGVEQYLEDLLAPDRSEDCKGNVVRAYSAEKTEKIRELFRGIGRLQLESCRPEAEVQLENEEDRIELDEDIIKTNWLKPAAAVETMLADKLKKYGILLEGKDADCFLRQIRVETYEKVRNDVALKDVNPETFKTAKERAEEADRLLHRELVKVPAEHQGTYQFFSRSSRELQEQIKTQDEHMTQLAGIRTTLFRETNTASELLTRLNTMEVDEKKDSALFTNMRKALERVTALGEEKSINEVRTALQELCDASRAYFEDHDTIFRKLKGDKGKNRLDISKNLVSYAEVALFLLEGYEIDNEKSIRSMVDEARKGLEERLEEIKRRDVSIEKLQEEENRKRLAAKKKPEPKPVKEEEKVDGREKLENPLKTEEKKKAEEKTRKRSNSAVKKEKDKEEETKIRPTKTFKG